jgi:predicted ATP-dependent endonuclease of OLD family
LHTVDRIEIKGFRGRPEPFVIEFDEEVNFIIGRNGTGKTRLINLINAALSADVAVLRAAPFAEISIRLIKYQKRESNDGEQILSYAIQRRTADAAKFEQVEYDEDAWSHHYRLNLVARPRWGQRPVVQSSNLKEEISAYVETTWLSVLRMSDPLDIEHDREYESPVDQRLHHVFR